MLNRITRANFTMPRSEAGRKPNWAVLARDTINGFLTTAHHAATALGLVAIALLAIMFMKPDFADRLQASWSSFAAGDTDNQASVDATMLSAAPAQTPMSGQLLGATTQTQAALATGAGSSVDSSLQQQRVASWLSKRYRVATDATSMLVSAAYRTAHDIKLDPLLILSVMAIESGFNPFAESPVGAKGLMQVMAKLHHDKFQPLGGVKAALNPLANIRVGSLILKDYVTRGGSVEAGLKLYSGAGNLDSDFGYGAKVLAEYHRLKEVATGKKVPVYATAAAPKQTELAPKVAVDTTAASAADTTAQPIVKTEQIAAL